MKKIPLPIAVVSAVLCFLSFGMRTPVLADTGAISFAGENYGLAQRIHTPTQESQTYIRPSETLENWTHMLAVRRLPYPDTPADYLEAVKESVLVYNPASRAALTPAAGGHAAALQFQWRDLKHPAHPAELHLLDVRSDGESLLLHEFIFRGAAADAQPELWEKEMARLPWPAIAANPAAENAWTQAVRHISWYIHNPHVFVERKLLDTPFSLAHRPSPPDHAWLYIRPNATLDAEDLPVFLNAVGAYRATGLDLKNQPAVNDQTLPLLLRSNGSWPLEPGWRQLLDGLRYLNVRGSAVTDAGAATLAQMTPLQVLILNDAITDTGLKTIATTLIHLVKFRPGGPAITDVGAQALQGLHQLHRLDLSETSVTGKGLRALSHLPLIEVDLGPAMGDDALAALQAIPTMVHIEMQKTKITDKGVEYLKNFSQLHTLFIASQLDDRGVQTLIQIPTLRRLDVSNSRITDKGLRALSALKDLEELGLTRADVGDQSLAALSHMERLRFLEVSNTRVTVAGLAQLSELPALDVVSFSHVGELTLGDLKPLGALRALRTVIINGAPLKHEALEYLLRNTQKANSRQTWNWIRLAYADGEPPLNDGMEVTQLVDKGSPNALHDVGLRRIHDVESDLDHVIPDVAAPRVNIPQDTADNFLGEINVDVKAPAR